MRSARAAFVFLTRVPVGGFPYTDAEWQNASAYFPLVGAMLGAALGVLDRVLLPLGPLAAAIAVLGASMLLTGGFHEDGLADTSDALGGAFDREKIFAILKDSRIGTFGACALVVSIAGRAALVARLGEEAAWALPLVGAAARVGPVWQIATMPYATAPDRAKSGGVARGGPKQAYLATAWAAVVAAALVGSGHVSAARVGAVAAACLVTTGLAGWRYRRRLGGITGDFLGATEQLCELAALGALAWGVTRAAIAP